MISAVNGFDIKNKESQNWDISEFLAKGGKVDKRNNLGQSIDEKGNLTDFEKSEFTVRFNGAPIEENPIIKKKKLIVNKISLNNEMSAKGKEARLKIQRPLFLKFKELHGKFSWSILCKALGGIITAQHLGCVYRGEYSIANQELWLVVSEKMKKMIKEKKGETKTA